VTAVTLGNFSGADTTAGSLNDGRYVLTALASQITAGGAPLDGNGDGTAGDNYTLTDAGGLFRLFGDADGDRDVDNRDLFALFGTFDKRAGDPGYLAFFDADGDGDIDNLDVFRAFQRYGTALS
jgi:hypothetical protein